MASPHDVRCALTSALPGATASNRAVTVPQPSPGTQPLIWGETETEVPAVRRSTFGFELPVGAPELQLEALAGAHRDGVAVVLLGDDHDPLLVGGRRAERHPRRRQTGSGGRVDDWAGAGAGGAGRPRAERAARRQQPGGHDRDGADHASHANYNVAKRPGEHTLLFVGERGRGAPASLVRDDDMHEVVGGRR